MEINQDILSKIETEDFVISLNKFIKENGWNVFYDIVKQLKLTYDPKIQKTKKEYKICPGITALLQKTHLKHNERLALMMTLLPMGKENELIEIMSRQDNYKASTTAYQIANYKAKGKMKGISHAKLKEWGICTC